MKKQKKQRDDLVLCLLMNKNKKEREIKQYRFADNVDKLWRKVCFVLYIEKLFSSSQKIYALAITLTQAFMMSLISMSWYRDVQAICLIESH